MSLRPVNVESRGDVFDDENQAGKVTSRARLRTAELLQKPFDVRSIALTGLFILAVFYTIYFMRSILLPIVLALLLSYLLRPIVRGLAKLKIPLVVSAAVILLGLLVLAGYGISALSPPGVARGTHPHRSSCACRLWHLRVGHPHGSVASESPGRLSRTATQAPAREKIGSPSDASD